MFCFKNFSNEKLLLSKKIIEIILKYYKNPKILDIGSGDAYITKKIAGYASFIIALGPKKGNYNETLEYIKKNYIKNISLYNLKYEDFKTTQKFDIILASHIIKNFSSVKIIDTFLNLLVSNGIIILIQQSKYSPQLVFEKILFKKLLKKQHKYYDSEQVMEYCKIKGWNIEETTIESYILADDLSSLINIVLTISGVNQLSSNYPSYIIKMLPYKKKGKIFSLLTIHSFILIFNS